MAHTSEYEVESLFIDRLESIGYAYVDLKNYDDVLLNLRMQLARFNAAKLTEKKGEASFSDGEFDRILIHLDNHTAENQYRYHWFTLSWNGAGIDNY